MIADILIAAAVVGGIVQVIKQASFMPDRFAGLLSLVLGAAGGATGWVDGGVLAGVIAGLTASGAYSAGQAGVVEPTREAMARSRVRTSMGQVTDGPGE